MRILDGLAHELTYELDTTKKHFANLPKDKFDFKPHEKSFSLGHLASHILEPLSWIHSILNDDVFNFNPEEYKPTVYGSSEELLAAADTIKDESLELLKNASDDILSTNWQMAIGGQVVMEMPKIAVFRNFVINHLIHHRGQLTVYMRLNDILVPKTYGPTADDQTM
ncbi:MAG: damage-inducible protein DinB [Planctomycetota bacterium]|nr:MAG: damage-inducible protein DinB [Planctomycetota bacterium]